MTLHLGQSSVLPCQQFPQNQSITKKISNYIFRFQDKIGQGNFSKVYKGFHQLTNEQVAIKIIELSSVKSAKLQELLFSEIEVIQSLNHPNILKCHQVLKSQNNCYIITELCNNGDLQSLIKRQKCLSQFSAARYIRDIFKGLMYLGQRGIVHRDLKIANIFLHNGICKIADFGFAKYTNNQNFLDLDIGSPLYMSPEGMIDHIYGMKTDIWSFGVIIYQLLHGKTPFSFCSSQYQLKRAVNVPLSYNIFRADISLQVKQLIIKCLTVNVSNRPDALSLANDYFLKNVLTENEKIEKVFVSPPQMMYQLSIQNPQNQMDNNNLGLLNIQNNRKYETYSNQSSNRGSNQNLFLPNIQNFTSEQHNVIQPQYYQNQGSIQQLSQQYLNQNSIHSNSPLQFNNNSPSRLIKNSSKESSLHGTDSRSNKSPNFYQPNQLIQKRLQYSPILQNHQSKSYGNIMNTSPNKSAQDFTLNLYPKNFQDHILTPKQLEKKINYQQIKQENNDQLQKTSHSSWSNNNEITKNKFPKAFTYGNTPKLQTNLSLATLPRRIGTQLTPASNQFQGLAAVNHKKNLQGSQNSTDSKQFSIIQSLPIRRVNSTFNSINNKPTLNFKQDPTSSINNTGVKKFGQMIKGQKRNQGTIKSSKKIDQAVADKANSPLQNLQQITQQQVGFQFQRPKIKSHLKNQSNILNFDSFSSPNDKKRPVRHSVGQFEFQNLNQTLNSVNNQSTNQSSTQNNNQFTNQPTTQSNNQANNRAGIPSFIQQKQKNGVSHRNVINTVIQFKQAVGFLHYCRLHFRFISTLKKLHTYTNQINKYQSLTKTFKNLSQQQQIYSRYLLTVLNELIDNIKCKEIIYDGENYKKKKIKEDKLKQVTEEYYKKYNDDINKSIKLQNKRITPTFHKMTTLDWIKQHNEQIWELLDQQQSHLLKLQKNDPQFSQIFLKNFRNLCYFAIRIIQANQILYQCLSLKNYHNLSLALIQNWLSQEYYSQQTYRKLKNQYLKRLAETSNLKNSETNDTEGGRNQYIMLS